MLLLRQKLGLKHPALHSLVDIVVRFRTVCVFKVGVLVDDLGDSALVLLAKTHDQVVFELLSAS